jgi:hypothetical protein
MRFDHGLIGDNADFHAVGNLILDIHALCRTKLRLDQLEQIARPADTKYWNG